MPRSTRTIALASLATITTFAAACGRPKDARPTITSDAGGAGKPPSASSSTISSSSPSTVPAVVVPVVATYAGADSAYNARDYGTATSMFDAYTQRHPDNPWGYYMLGLSAWKAGDLPRAESALEHSLALDPKHVKTLVNLGRVELDAGDADSALARATAAVVLDSSCADAWRLVGRANLVLDQEVPAIDAFRKALLLNPKDVWSMNDMGLQLIQSGRYDEALPVLARAVQLDSTEPAFLNNLGLALERTGHVTDAATMYEQAVALDGDYTKAQVSLARVTDRPNVDGVDPVSIDVLAGRFNELYAQWQAEGAVAVAHDSTITTHDPTAVAVAHDTATTPH